MRGQKRRQIHAKQKSDVHMMWLHWWILMNLDDTERQKKLITSSEWHSLKSTASKWFIFGHRLGKFILNKHNHLEKKVYFNQRGDKCDEIARGQFSKITEIACLSGWEFEADNSPYGVYLTRHWNWMNSYWMFWIGRLRGASLELARWAVSAIFEKLPFVIQPHFSPFWSEKILCFSDILIKKY